MNLWDILLLILIGAALGAAVFFLFFRHKRSGSSCGCSCSSCAGMCALCEKGKKES